MSENEEKKETKESEVTDGNTNDGSEPQELESVKQANLAAERMEKATSALKVENDRAEQLAARGILGGKSNFC